MNQRLLLSLCLTFLFCSVSAFAEKPTTCADEEHYPLINKSELKKVAGKKSAFIVDVNSADSFKKAHVPGAIHFKAKKDEFTQLLPKDKNALVVAYCGGPQCTAWKEAAKIACEN